jgi:predicted Zn-dependent protease
MGVKLISEAGLRPLAMSETWDQLIAELDASARYRRRKHRERRANIFETHPSPEARRADLRASAAEVTMAGRNYDDGRARYLQAIAAIRPMLLDDQVKLNDPGASQYVVETLARDGWNGLLRFYEGEIWRLRNRAGDDARAAQGYAAAVMYPDAPPDAWRWHGIMLQKSGRVAEARMAYSRYLAMAPNAPDAPFIRQQLQQ